MGRRDERAEAGRSRQALRDAPGRRRAAGDRAAAFNARDTEISEAKPYFGGVTTDDGNYAVFAVTQVRNADPSKEAGRREDRPQASRGSAAGNEEFAAYIEEAERTTKIVKNDKVFE